jgi:hypothetical protein
MKTITGLEIGLVVFIALMVLLPIGIATVIHPPQAYTSVSENPVKEILEKKGIRILHEKDTLWDLPGATGGKGYTITDADGRETLVRTQTFDSDAACDAAIRTWHTSQAGRGRANGYLLVNGREIVIITPADRPVIEVIGRERASGNLR